MYSPDFVEKGVILEYLEEKKFDEDILAKDIKWLKNVKKEIDHNPKFVKSFTDLFLTNDKLNHLQQKYEKIRNKLEGDFTNNEEILIKKSKGLSKMDKLIIVFSLGTTFPYIKRQRKDEIKLRSNYRSWNRTQYLIIDEKVLPRIERLLKKVEIISNSSR